MIFLPSHELKIRCLFRYGNPVFSLLDFFDALTGRLRAAAPPFLTHSTPGSRGDDNRCCFRPSPRKRPSPPIPNPNPANHAAAAGGRLPRAHVPLLPRGPVAPSGLRGGARGGQGARREGLEGQHKVFAREVGEEGLDPGV